MSTVPSIASPKPAHEARGGIFVSIMSKSGVQLVNLLAVAVLARILMPSDFGLIAMVMAVVGIGHLFKDMGLGIATVRAPTLSAEQINSLFWISAGLGAVIATVVFLAAPLVAALYQDPRLLPITRVVAVSFLLSGLSAQPLALMRRHMAFRGLALINVSAALISQAIGIALALRGFGYWALVVAALAASVLTTLMGLAFSGIRIGCPRLAGELAALLSFGGHVVVFALLGFFALNAHNLILGIYHDAALVGLYHRALMILSLLVSQLADPLGLVATPVLARLQDDLPAYRQHYLDSAGLLVAFAAALSVMLYIGADDIVAILLGPKWHESAAILRILAIGLLPQVLCNSTGWLYLSHGDTRAMMWWGLGGWGSLTVLLVLAAPAGALAMATAYSAGMFLLLIPCLLLALRKARLSVWQVFRVCIPACVSAAVGLVALMMVAPYIATLPLLLRLGLQAAMFTLIYSGLLLGVFRQAPILAQALPALRKKSA